MSPMICIISILLWAQASASPVLPWNIQDNTTLFVRDAQADHQPHTFGIKKMAAVGDSYSAGIGAGERLGVPVLGEIFNDDGGQNVILLSGGGNDVKLTDVLNQCIFQWAAVSKTQTQVAKAAILLNPAYEWLTAKVDWDAISRGCDGQLDHTGGLIDGLEFTSSLSKLIEHAKLKLAAGGMIYYTGQVHYAKFFAEDMSPECDKVTWSTWLYKATSNNYISDEYLTQTHRRRMNELVDRANSKIKEAISRSGPQVKYIDYDSLVGYYNGRFCERGVDEASKASNSRPGLMFYELDMKDPLGNTPWKRSDNPVIPGTFEAELEVFAQLTVFLDPDATMRTSGVSLVSTKMRTVSGEAQSAIAAGLIPHMLPDGYGRVFHPTKLLHALIAQEIIWEIEGPWIPPPGSGGNACPLSPGKSLGENGRGDLRGPVLHPGSTGPINNGKKGKVKGSHGKVSTETGQQVALASYINPSSEEKLWERMIKYPSNKLSVLVANVLNGPDSKPHKAWASVIEGAHKSGKTIIGYVRTGYLGVSKQKFKTMLGSTDLGDWIAQIESDIEAWYRHYPGNIAGIFLDEAWNECGADDIYAKVYRLISDNTKRRHEGAYIVLNPGWFMPKCFEESADTLMTFESSYTRYLDRTGTTYKDNGWIPADHRKIWHIIYDVPKENIGEVVSLAKERHAGLLHITNAGLSNPYNKLPDTKYMDALMDAVDVGGPLIQPAHESSDGVTPSPPHSLQVVDSDYTSVTLNWTIAGDVDAVAIYLGEEEMALVPDDINRVTIGNLKIGHTGHEFKVGAVKGKSYSDFSNSAWADTDSLPDGKGIVNITVSATASETIYEANILIPYAFIRILVTDPICDYPAYPISTDKGVVCAKYMIEGETSYKYSATDTDPKTGFWPWSWTPTSPLNDEGNNMKVERDVYHYTWHLPIGTSTINTNNFIVQGEGVSPRIDVFYPCPCKWAGKDGIIGKFGEEQQYCEGGQQTMCRPYDCEGHHRCALSPTKWCDKAVNQMNRGSRMYRSNGVPFSEAGNCWADRAGYGCSVQIRGKHEGTGEVCQISGDDMWHAYQDIRHKWKGKCGQCGSKHFGNGCLVSIDYAEGCDNRDGGVMRMAFDSEELGEGQSMISGVMYGSMTGAYLGKG